MKNAVRTLLALVLWLPFTIAANAGDDWPHDIAKATLIPGWKTESGSQMAAFHVRLAPGWKTYWRAPGDTGIPPRFSWAGSQNLQAVHFHWPTPTIFDQTGTRTIGYQDELVLPIEFIPREDGPIVIKAEFELGLCLDVCLPVSGRLSAHLQGPGTPNPLILASLESRPDSPAAAKIGNVKCSVEPISDGLRLSAEFNVPPLGQNEIAVVEFGDQTIWVSEAVTQRVGGTLTATAEMVPPNGQPFLLDRSQVTVTIFGDTRVVEIPGCPSG